MSVTAGAIALGAGIAASANFLQSRMSENAAGNLNETNRDFQREMYARQLADTERLYNLYNSPSALKRQYLEAGINPSLVGGSSPYHGSGVSAPTASAAPSTALPDYSGISRMGSDTANLLLTGSQVSANVANQNADTAIKAAKAYSDMLKSGSDKDKAYEVFQGIMKSAGFADDMISDLSTAINQDALSAQLANDRASLEYELRNKYGFKQAKAEADKAAESVELVTSQIKVNKANYSNALAQAKKALSEAATNNETREWLVKQLQAQAEMLEASKALEKNSFVNTDNLLVKLLNTLALWLSGSISIGGMFSRGHATTQVIK